MPLEERVNNIISLMNDDEKIALLSQSPGVARLGIPSMQQAEGLHGVKAGRGGSTTYPQSIGLGETWDTEVTHQVGAAEGYESRYNRQHNAAPAGGRGGRGGGAGSFLTGMFLGSLFGGGRGSSGWGGGGGFGGSGDSGGGGGGFGGFGGGGFGGGGANSDW